MSTTTDSAAIGHTDIVHCQQNANYVTPSEHDVFVHHVECLRDGGILDPDDQLFDVFDENNDQILAIYDEPGFAATDSALPNASRFVTAGAACKSNVTTSSSNDGDIEITNIAVPPTGGLRVISDNAHTLQQKPSSSSAITNSGSVSPPSLPLTRFDRKRSDVSNTSRIYHSALKNVSGSPKTKYRVTISPDVHCQPCEEELSIPTKESPMTRTSARKSRLTDSFFDAKERLDEKLATSIKSCTIKTDTKIPKLIPLMEAANRGQTVMILSDSTINMQMGIEISPVHDPANNMRLQAVEIRQIDIEGRVGSDGRLRIGDRIVEINQRPVYQMSISRARAYLHEIEAIAHPSLTIDRSIETFTSDAISHRSQSSTSSLQKRPIFSALQQANTTAVGTTFPVEIVKRSGGFGFTITSRETAKGERLFYIGNVKSDGAAVNKLRAGDRLLQINGEKTAELTQNDMVERLKKLDVGDSINLLISRLGSQESANQNATVVKSNQEDKECCQEKGADEGPEQYGEEILTLDIALNETGSAGLGISLKARAVMKPDGTRHDCGIFIKKVLHGGAAYKDGRLQVNDQLVGIENIDLRRMLRNSEASDAITSCLKGLGPNANSVCLHIARKVKLRHNNGLPGVRSSVSESLTPNVGNSSRAKAEDGDNAIVKKEETSNGYNKDMPTRQLSSSDERSSNANEDLNSISSSKQKCVSEDEMSGADGSAFNRKNPARKSISEKRHMGVESDANNTLLFQKIKHNRQLSAPLLHRFIPFVSPTVQSRAMSSSRSATLLLEKCRRRSSTSFRTSGEKVVTRGCGENHESDVTTPFTSANSINKTSNESTSVVLSPSSPNRRSLSLESMEAFRSRAPRTVSAHPHGSTIRDVGVEQMRRRGHPSTLKRTQKSRSDGIAKPSASGVEEPISAVENRDESCVSLPREVSATSKEKQQRRKSMGSSIFSKITQRLGGSKSRDASPEKSTSFDTAGSNSFTEMINRPQDYRKWNKESKSDQSVRKAPPPYKPSCGIFHSAEPHYYISDAPGTHKTEIVCSREELPASGYIRVANSKFYNSFIESQLSVTLQALYTIEYAIRLPCMTEIRPFFACLNLPNMRRRLYGALNKVHPEIRSSIAERNIKRQFTTTTNVVSKMDKTHISTAKQETDMAMIYACSSSNNNSDSNMQSTRSTAMKEDVSSSSNVWRITRDAMPITTMSSMRGLRTVQRPLGETCLSLQEEEVDIHPSTPTLLRRQQKQNHRIEQPYDKFTTKDSDRVQLSFPHQECEGDRAWKGLVHTTQLPMPHIPAVFPTSRTFFFSPSARMSGHRANDSRAGAPRPNLRNRAQSIFTLPSKECTLAENNVNHQRLCPGHSQQNQSPCSSLPSSPHPEKSVPLMPYAPYNFGETTFSSPTYLHGLLESPRRKYKDPKPVKYIKIHYGPSHPSSPKQQPLRTRIANIRSSNNDSFQQEFSNGFDYRKYLRSKRRNRINDEKQRVTLIATVPDERIFVRGSATHRARRPTTTLFNATINS
ncbi:unnamed protein product [Litomosoides sigmodontis]|uniref:PDZ domain-containing protein n=1 Tax=Litomosoides sigmodontis TaxID=42156 RepID=A0A3P6SEL5_LITSI|nr:unnamed protein product [Litomosoides sigmodontis]